MSSYETAILRILQREGFAVEREKSFKDLKHGLYRFDFYLPTRGVVIEVDGEYHFKPIRGRQALLKQQEHDRRKNSYCLAHQIPLYRIPYWDLASIKHSSEIFSEKYRVSDAWWNDNLWREYRKKV